MSLVDARNKRINFLLGFFSLLALSSGVVFFTLPDTMIEDVFIADKPEDVVYTIRLSYAFELVDHLPQQKTEIVQVALRSTSLFAATINEYLGSEAISPDILQSQLLTDIAYEGLVVGGPYLTIRFKEPVDYLLTVDKAAQSIVLIVKK